MRTFRSLFGSISMKLNALFRFLLELTAILVFGTWGHSLSDPPLNILTALILPLGFVLLWGIFATRNDPSRSGKTVVQTPGWIRLLLELLLFGSAVWMLLDLERGTLALLLTLTVILHYSLAWKRSLWLFSQR